MQRLFVRLLPVLLAALLFCGCGGRKKQREEEPARVLGYTPQQVRLVLLSARARTEELYTDQVWQVRLGEQGESYEQAFLEEMEDFFLELCAMGGMAEERGLRLSAEEQVRLSDAAQAFYESSARGDSRLSDLTREETEQLFLDYAAALRLKQQLSEDRDAEVSESEARVIRLELVRTDDRAVAETIRDKALEGGDLYALAQTYAAGRGVPVKAGRGDLPKEVEEEVFSLEEGQVSSVWERDGMFCVYRLADSYDEAETRKRRLLLREQRVREMTGKAYREYLRRNQVLVDEEVFRQAREGLEGGYTGPDFFRAVQEALYNESISV